MTSAAPRPPSVRATAIAGASLGIVAAAGMLAVWRHRDWIATTDYALLLIELQRLATEPQLVGSYSRLGWNHPGPALQYLLWGPWRLFGGAPPGLLAGMLVLHLGCVALAWLATQRRSPGLAGLVGAALLLTWAASAEAASLAPWNPNVAVVGAGLLLVAAWRAGSGARSGAALLLPVSSVLVQAHIGTALYAAALVAATVALVAAARVRRDQPIPWRWWLAGAAVAVVMWVPPLVQQATGDPGNLTAILTSPAPGGLGLRDVPAVMSHAFGIPAYWWSADPALPLPLTVPWLLAVPPAAIWIRRGDPEARRFACLFLVVLAALGLTITRLDEPMAYLIAWVPAFVTTSLAISIWLIATRRSPSATDRWAPWLLPISAAVVAIRMVTAPLPFSPGADAIPPAVAAISADPATRGGVVVYPVGPPPVWEATVGLVAALQRNGVPAGVANRNGTPWQRHLLKPPQGAIPVWLRVVDQMPADVPPDQRVLAESDPFDAAEWRELHRLAAVAADPTADAATVYAARAAAAELADGRFAWQLLTPRATPEAAPGVDSAARSG